MFTLGLNFPGGDLACAYTPTVVEDITFVQIGYGIYDDLYITKNTEFEFSHKCPDHWDFDTIFKAPFNNSTNAGNMDWSLETTSHLIIKKRLEGNFTWQIMSVKEVHELEDFVMHFNDYTCASGANYDYAIVPVFYGIEGIYSQTMITSFFYGMYLIEPGIVYHTEMTDLNVDTERNIPSSNVELMNNQYPIFVRNTIANYDTGSCRGAFVPLEDDECTPDIDDDYKRTSHQKKVMDFLADSVTKILKIEDGRIWLVQVTPNPTDKADQLYKNRNIDFTWVEIGSTHSEKDLYLLGHSDVSEEWWS